jgi:hypothetical protein
MDLFTDIYGFLALRLVELVKNTGFEKKEEVV